MALAARAKQCVRHRPAKRLGIADVFAHPLFGVDGVAQTDRVQDKGMLSVRTIAVFRSEQPKKGVTVRRHPKHIDCTVQRGVVRGRENRTVEPLVGCNLIGDIEGRQRRSRRRGVEVSACARFVDPLGRHPGRQPLEHLADSEEFRHFLARGAADERAPVGLNFNDTRFRQPTEGPRAPVPD